MSANRGELPSREYQREAEATRHRLADHLDELNERLTPGQVFDEVLSYARGGSGTFVRALANAARENPIPTLLIGAGCALFVSDKMSLRRFASGNGSRRGTYVRAGEPVRGGSSDAMETVSARAEEVAGSVRSTARSASEFGSEQSEAVAAGMRRGADSIGETVSGAARRVAGAAQIVRETASGVAQSVRGSAAGAAQTMREAGRGVRDQVGGTAERLKRGARDMGDSVQQYTTAAGEQFAETSRQASRTAAELRSQARSFVNEQPLLCAAIGVALGAALAAALPKTETEDELMGETSDALKERLGEVASAQLETARAAAGKAAQQAMTSVAREGLTAFGAAEAAAGIADKVRRVVTDTASAGASEIRDRLDNQN